MNGQEQEIRSRVAAHDILQGGHFAHVCMTYNADTERVAALLGVYRHLPIDAYNRRYDADQRAFAPYRTTEIN
jgi:hypothetical protein